MKKLLTIMVLALALCLLCSAALADTYAGEFTAAQVKAKVEGTTNWTLNDYVLTAGTITVSPSTKELADESADCTKPTIATVRGQLADKSYVEVAIGVYPTAAKTHTWEDDATGENVAAKCGEAGKKAQKCKVCGKTRSVELPALKHSYLPVDTSTCKAAGKITYVCTNCGDVLKDELGKIVEVDGVKLTTHTWSLKLVAPHCNDAVETDKEKVVDGSVTVVCFVCEVVATDWTKDNIPTLLTNAGLATKTPSSNAVTVAEYAAYKNDTSFDGHKWGAWGALEAADCDHAAQQTHRCSVCAKTESKKVSADAKPLDPIWVLDPTITCATIYNKSIRQDIETELLKFVCKVCNGKSAAHKDGLKAKYHMTAVLDDVSYTGGYEIYTTDTVTGKVITATVMHNAAPTGNVHYTWSSNSAATLDAVAAHTNGKDFCAAKDAMETKEMYCSVCKRTNTFKTKYTGVHYFGDWKKSEDTLDVNKWTRLCKICGTAETTTTQPILNPCKPADHVWTIDTAKNTVEIKCGKNAGVAQICSVCGTTKVDVWERKDEWKVVAHLKAATCTEDGIDLAVCTYENCTNVDYPVAPATGHTPVAIAEVPATCLKAGTKAGYQCSVCEKYLDSNAKDAKVIEALEVIPINPDAHQWNATETLVAPKCYAVGTGLKTCSVCGKAEKVELPRTEHKWDAGEITTPATKDADGVRTYKCTNEGCTETKTEAVKYEVTAPAKYTMTAEYDGTTVTGKLAHVEDTLEADAKYVRVTFYIGTYYMATTAEVDEDDTFSVDGVGPIEYITIVANGNSSVNPDDVKAIADPKEIYVK